jgi:uncharacterized membrane protein
MDVRQAVDTLGLLIDLVGVAVIVAGIALATGLALRMVFAGERDGAYLRFRRGVGRSILLGIEILVAGDIIRTVAIEPTFDSILVLGGIILIRTFLSFSLEVELTGTWPWRRSDRPVAGRE